MLSIMELAAELERQNDAKVDFLADTRKMHFVSTPSDDDTPARSELDLLGDDNGPAIAEGLVLNDIAHDQVATHLGIPLRYYRRLQGDLPGLLDVNVNQLLRHKPEQRMVRTLDGRMRAYLSDRYRDLDNWEIAQAVLPVLNEIPDVRVQSCGLTESRLYIKAVTPRVAGDVKVGDEVCAGVVITNSEVGMGSLSVQPLIFRLVCLNGMIVGRQGEGMMRQVHVGGRRAADEFGHLLRDETRLARDRAFMMEVADVVRAAVDEVRFRDLLASMQAATEGERLKDPVAAVQVLAKRENLAEGESRNVLRYLAEGGDLSRWGMLNAVTRASQDSTNYDRATELEALGGGILAYGQRDWEAIARATV